MRRAGTYAESRYRSGLASWRRRSLPGLAWRFALLDVGMLILAGWFRTPFVWFVAGVVVGANLLMLYVVWEMPPDAIQVWGLGAEANA
jgi:hypothetical protein